MTQDTHKFERADFHQRYLHKKLSDSERIAFELYLLDHPEMVDTLEIDQLYQQTLADAVNHNLASSGFWHWIRAHCWATPMRASFCTFAACAVVFALSHTGGGNTGTGVSKGLVSSQVEYLETVRSASAELPVFVLKKDSDVMALMVQTYFAKPDATYWVKVTAKAAERVVMEYQVKGNEHGELLVALTREQVHIGEYQVVVSDENHDTPQEIGFYLEME